jgi:hypothetical protein
MHFETEPQPQSYADKKIALITQDHLADIKSQETPDLKIQLEKLKNKIDEQQKLLDDKKGQLQKTLKQKAPHQEIEVISLELISQYENLKDLELQLGEIITSLELKK